MLPGWGEPVGQPWAPAGWWEAGGGYCRGGVKLSQGERMARRQVERLRWNSLPGAGPAWGSRVSAAAGDGPGSAVLHASSPGCFSLPSAAQVSPVTLVIGNKESAGPWSPRHRPAAYCSRLVSLQI